MPRGSRKSARSKRSRKSRGRKSRASRRSRNGSGKKPNKKQGKKTIGSKSLRGLLPTSTDISNIHVPSEPNSNMSLTQLQNIAAKRGIPFGGLNKEILIRRINKYA